MSHTPGPTDKPWSYGSRLSGSENHKGFNLRDAHGVLLAHVMPLDEDGEEGEGVAAFIVRAVNTHKQLLEALEAALRWIDAVPKETALPVMPGFDRDWVDAAIAAAKEGK